MTPPFGYNLFLMKAMAPDEVSLADIYRSIVPFVLVMMVGLVIVILFPEIALWLPKLYFGRWSLDARATHPENRMIGKQEAGE